MGVAAGVQDVSTGTWYPTGIWDHTYELDGIVEFEPDQSFFTDPNYDFSNWVKVVLEGNIEWTKGPYLELRNDYGARVWAHTKGSVAVGTFWFKTDLPFC